MSLHLVNWNVNGIRSIIKKDFEKDIRELNPDILCMQEHKAAADDVRSVLEVFPEYKSYINDSKARKGYSGTAILSKREPIRVTYDMDLEEHDQEGRVITAEYETFILVTVYTPNAGEGLKRLDYRQTWDVAFREYVDWLNRRKPVIICGDLNVAHREIDIARPKQNYNKSAGYTQQEIDGFSTLLESGFVDTFRNKYPDTVKYTYWNYVFNARANNAGWRIDYFLVSERLLGSVEDAMVYDDRLGSDHCPVGLRISV